MDLWKRKEFTEEHKQKLQAGRKKFIYTPEVREKMSKLKLGKPTWNKGKQDIYSQETKEKMGASMRGKRGAETHNWKGGLNPMWIRKQRLKTNGGQHTKEEWECLKEEHNWICVNCFKSGEITKDHIIPVSKGGTDDIKNIQPLCRSCNSRKHNQLN